MFFTSLLLENVASHEICAFIVFNSLHYMAVCLHSLVWLQI